MIDEEEVRAIVKAEFEKINEAFIIQSNLYQTLTTGQKQSFTLKYAPLGGDLLDWAIGVTTQKHVTNVNRDKWK